MTDGRPPQADADHAAPPAGGGLVRDEEQAEIEHSPENQSESSPNDSPEAFSIDDVLRDAERLMNGEPVASTPDAPGDSPSNSVTHDATHARIDRVATDEFELDDLQSAIDEAIREAEEKKSPPSIPPEPDHSPVAAMSDVEAEVARAVAQALAEVESTSSDSPAVPIEPAPPASAPAVPHAAAPQPATPAAADPLAVEREAELDDPNTPSSVASDPNEAVDVDALNTDPSESDEHFAAVETVLAAEESSAASLAAAAPEAEEDAAGLDAALAAKGKAALDAEEDSEPAETMEAVPAAHGEATVVPPEPQASPSRSTSADAAPATPDVVIASPASRSRVASIARRACRTIAHSAADRYTRIGDGPRKIVAWSAWGTLVQAAVLWTWILFLRSGEVQLPDPHTEVKSAAHASSDSHGASDAHGSHGAPAADKGHGSHGAASKDDSHGARKPRETRGSAKKGGSRSKDGRGSKKKEEPPAAGHH